MIGAKADHFFHKPKREPKLDFWAELSETSRIEAKKFGRRIPDLPVGALDGVCEDQSHCSHLFFDKWEGVYVCKFCRYKMNEMDDSDRIKSEVLKEKQTPNDDYPSGLSDEVLKTYIGKKSQERGVTIGFLLAFTKKFNCWQWTAREVISRIILPATQADRVRYVELDWMKEYIGPATTFVSYAQAGPWGDLVAAILDGGADFDRTVWIDVFAVRQWPSDTPDLDFASTIEHCDSFMCVCSYITSVEDMDWHDVLARKTKTIPISDRIKIAFLRVWCLVEIAAAAKNVGMPRIMKCGSYKINRDASVSFDNKSDVLWKLSHFIDIENAEATVASDKERILDDIRRNITVDVLNSVVRGILAGAKDITNLGSLGSVVQCAACGDADARSIMLRNPDSILAVCAGGYEHFLDLLLGYNFNVSTKDEYGKTALMFACGGGHDRLVQKLLVAKADVHAKSSKGWTSLMAASQGGHKKVVDMLLQQDADVSEADEDGTTALMIASQGGHENVVSVLMTSGADVLATDKAGTAALMMASVRGHMNVVRLLLDNGADRHIDAAGDNGTTALMLASDEGYGNVVQALLEAGADRNINAQNHDGRTALMKASRRGFKDVVRILLMYHADVNIESVKGYTAIMLAEKGGHSSVVDILLDDASK